MMNIGYACLTTGVPNTGFKTCIIKNATDEKLRELISHNLTSLETIIDYNIKNAIKLFRISSDIIPFGSNPINKLEWEKEFEAHFQRIGEKIRNSNMRVSMHPGQYTVLNSIRYDVANKAIIDLEYHEKFLSALGTDKKSKIVIHLGGVYGDKKKAVESFAENYKKLNPAIMDRLVIENDDRSYNIKDILKVSEKLDIPVVYDNLHNEVNKADDKDDLYWIKQCSKTWRDSDGKQKIHYSQQNCEKQAGAHTETIAIDKFMEFYKNKENLTIDIMLEVKDKNISALKCLNCINQDRGQAMLQKDWARYKYAVMEKSQTDYRDIVSLFRKKDYPAVEFYRIAEKSFSYSRSIGDEKNAAMHVWGYFKNIANKADYKKFIKLLDGLNEEEKTAKKLKSFLYSLAQKHTREYLLDSYYFKNIM